MELEQVTSPVRQALSIDDGYGIALCELADAVGGVDALDSLHGEPLPTDRLDLDALTGKDRQPAEAILAAIERFACRFPWGNPLDDEHRTIVARILRRILAGSAPELHRSTADRVAAALVWLTLGGNGELRSRGLSGAFIWDGFGVSNASAIGRRLHRAAGLPPVDPEQTCRARSPVWLGDTDLLHSRARRRLIAERDAYVQALAELRAERAARAPVRPIEGGVAITGVPTSPRWALRAPDTAGRHVVFVAFGDDRDLDVRGFTVPDAHRLVHLLQQALAAS